MKPRLTRGKGEIQGSPFEIMKNLDKIIQIFVSRVPLRVDLDNFVMVTFIVKVGILISLQTMVFPIVLSFNAWCFIDPVEIMWTLWVIVRVSLFPPGSLVYYWHHGVHVNCDLSKTDLKWNENVNLAHPPPPNIVPSSFF